MQKLNKIILMGRPKITGVPETVKTLYEYLSHRKIEVALDHETASMLPIQANPNLINEAILSEYDLMIVVGGDGSLLNAAHLALPYNLPVLGINRGRLGFLTDIHPQDLDKVGAVLDGHYYIEHRFLLDARFFHAHGNTPFSQNIALNDVVLLPGDISHMISFEIYIDQQFVCRQRADGLIMATPTGSTAYALSGGGPILHPHLDAIVLVPMFPHTLTSRPIVISSACEIELHISSSNIASPHISCDGQNRIALAPGGKVKVYKKSQQLRLVHPEDYNYFKTLREKLKWENALSNAN
ncbi:MAG: NAD(+) kinase [Proteobacteria bacterium]|nr:NAD(+) kinase [Pseudomonadota bacterium]